MRRPLSSFTAILAAVVLLLTPSFSSACPFSQSHYSSPSPSPYASPSLSAAFNLTAAAIDFLHSPGSRSGHPRHPVPAPYVPRDASDPQMQQRRAKVRAAMAFAWDSYAKHAWGHDELHALRGVGVDNFAAGLGVTILDSLSTLYVMNLTTRYTAGRAWVADSLDLSAVGAVPVFETVIRCLGGLLSAYALSGDRVFLARAEELGARLAPAFDRGGRPPWPRCYLHTHGRCELRPPGALKMPNMKGNQNDTTLEDEVPLAETASIQLELHALAAYSDHPLFKSLADAGDAVLSALRANAHTGTLAAPYAMLMPKDVSFNTGAWGHAGGVTLGGSADSTFEYAAKLWAFGGRSDAAHFAAFSSVADAAVAVAATPVPFGGTLLREIFPANEEDRRAGANYSFRNHMDHLACFLPGALVVALPGLPASDTARREQWLALAEGVSNVCKQMYDHSLTGLAGEAVEISSKGQWKTIRGYQLRPEAVEAFFYMHRYTGDQRYRDATWNVFERIQNNCIVQAREVRAGKVHVGGYASLTPGKRPRQTGPMHSYLLAETFKYAYLAFGDHPGELPLDQWVFNTEAHPLRIPDATV